MPQSLEGRVSLTEALPRVAHSFDVLAGVDLTSATDAELAEAVVESRRLLLRLGCLDAKVAGRFDASAAWAGEARSAAGWLAQHTHASAGETYARLRLAGDTTRHPVMGDAVAAGQVSVEHLRELAKTHRRLPALATELDAVEDVITDYARQTTPAELRLFLDKLARHIAPDVVDDADKDTLEDRAHLTVTEMLDGWVSVSGMFPPDLGGRLLSALRALTLPITLDTQPGADTDAASGGEDDAAASAALDGSDRDSADVEGSAPEETGRQGRQEGAQSLLEPRRPLSQRRLDARLRGHLPIVNVTVSLDDLSTPPGDGNATLLTPAAKNPVVIPADTARKHACDALIRRLVLDPAGVPLDVGRRQRTVSPALAAAVQQRDRHCRWPGCRQRIDHAHHVVHWAHGGGTDLQNLLGLCGFHHHVAHSGEWILHGNANTHVTIRPTGTGRGVGRVEMTSRPPDDHHFTRALDRQRHWPDRA